MKKIIKQYIVVLKKIFFLFISCSISTVSFGFTINQSGMSNLGGDIVESGTVIQISVSNVTFDMAGYTLSGGTNGIVVDAGLSNVVIRNGRINNNTQGITIGAGCSDIVLENITISNCSLRAVEVNGTVGSPVMRLSLANINSELSATAASITDSVMIFSFVTDLIVQNVQVAGNGASTVNLRGVYLLNCDKATLENVTVIGNQGATFQGFRIENTINSLCNNCEVRVNTATGDLVGFRFTGGTNTSGNLCRNCNVFDNTSTNGPLVGFELLALVTRNMLTDCLSANNVATAAVSTANCFGFNFDQPTFCSVVRCRAESNRATGDGTSNNCAGFNIGTSGVGTTGTKNCEFCYNQSSLNNGFNDARSFGFRAVSLANGNTNNAYISNFGVRNGPTTPVLTNQIVADGGAGSNPGGVPLGSIRDLTVGALNIPAGIAGLATPSLGVSNIRIN
jgi:hypothetical protein